MTTFEVCGEINDLLTAHRDNEARDVLIRLLDELARSETPYGPMINRLIRTSGLFPYMEVDSANWDDRFAFESFKVNIGGDQKATLHREQSQVLSRLIAGEDLAISAPTSFGKSFIIDAFIAIKKPANVVIIVPTLALTDETRRRLQKKFGRDYKLITTAGAKLGERNIFVFPQERAVGYLQQMPALDLLVVDEFYKASPEFDRERSPTLLRALLKLSAKATQRYFLAPNIAEIGDNPFTHGMKFARMDFNTVFLEKQLLYERIGNDPILKGATLLNILKNAKGKTLIYAGSYTNIGRIANLLLAERPLLPDPLLQDCASWLSSNYDATWILPDLIQRGVGIHNGQLHRPLSQIQIKLFEEDLGLSTIISTSSIIEGVNTSAENVVVWSNKNGQPLLDDFTYKNIIGRGGRMFKHFVGKIFVLERPPRPVETELALTVPEELLGILDEDDYPRPLTAEQVAAIVEYRREMSEVLGADAVERIQSSGSLHSSDSNFILRAARDIAENAQQWGSLNGLNSDNPTYWDAALYRVINLQRSGWDAKYSTIVAFVKVISDNWEASLPELLSRLEEYDVGIDEFFKLERTVSFKLAALLGDVNVIQKEMIGERGIDISPFVARLGHAFLPPLVYQLEEYGLPRMLARRIHDAGLLDLEDADAELHDIIDRFNTVGLQDRIRSSTKLDPFEHYLLDYFFEGISSQEHSRQRRT